jgi:protein ImuB
VPRQLWLALRFTTLALRAAAPERIGATGPLVVVSEEGAQRLIATCNAAAARAGIHPGLKLAAAHALAPELEVIERAPIAEARELERLAHWALNLTPFVSLERPDALLLEVQGSLGLFGGSAALLERATRGLIAEGHAPAVALAPTPRAALWLACARPGTAIESAATLAGALARLPLDTAGWSARTLEDCARLGVRTVGELKRLPRDGIARRFEPTVLLDLDEAHGTRPTPRRRYLAPERFRERFELPAELTGTGELTPYCEHLIGRLGEFLTTRNAGVARLAFLFQHRGLKPSCVLIGRALPAADVGGWRELLRERLMRVVLPAPVLALTLRTGAAVALTGTSGALKGFGTPGATGEALALLDRLRARLGDAAVTGVCLVPEHRPEAAWRAVRPANEAPGGAVPALPESARPLWLLAAPQPLADRDGEPRHGGALTFESGPERIESGWWDGAEVRRDYYVAVSAHGARLWIFREHERRDWFLHGVFG